MTKTAPSDNTKPSVEPASKRYLGIAKEFFFASLPLALYLLLIYLVV